MERQRQGERKRQSRGKQIRNVNFGCSTQLCLAQLIQVEHNQRRKKKKKIEEIEHRRKKRLYKKIL